MRTLDEDPRMERGGDAAPATLAASRLRHGHVRAVPRFLLAPVILLASLGSGCASRVEARRSAARSEAGIRALARLAARDLGCPREDVTVDAERGLACGCNASAHYLVICEPGCGWSLARPVRRPALCVGPLTSGAVGQVSVRRIRETMARRAGELGGRVRSGTVRLELVAGEVAPGCRVLAASWGGGRTESSLTGLILDGRDLDTYPLQALGKIFARWKKAGPMPEAWRVVSVVSFLLGGPGRGDAILSEGDIRELVRDPELRRQVGLPELIQVNGQPGVRFFCVGRYGVSRLRVHLSAEGRVRVEEVFLRATPPTAKEAK